MGLTYDIPELSTEGQPVLLLSVHNVKDRKLIKQFLPDSMAIETSRDGIAGRDFDLCILDYPSFDANKQSLQELKDEAAPIFLPFLLLSPNQKAIRNNATVLEFADDVVYIPASPKLLQSRISLLLKQREYSLKLEEKSRQLEQANKELKEEKEKYQLLTDNSTDMISVHKPDGTYLYVSPASEELIGYTPEELVGKNAFDNIHPEDQEPLLEAEEPFADNEIIRVTFRKGIKDGGYKWVESTMRPIRDEDTGEVTEIQAGTRDISARKKYEHELEEEKEFIDKSIQSLPELFFLIDEDQNFVKWNNIERELGYTDEEIPEMDPLDFYKKEDHSFIISKIEEAFGTGNAEAEVQMQAKDGEIIPYYVTANSFQRGEKRFIVGSCINLSEIKETQYELEQHRQLLDAIINQTKSIIYVKDQDKKYRLVNESFVDLFDRDRENILGKTSRELHGREFYKQVKENDNAVLKYGKTIETEEAIPVRGETRYYHSIKYPLKGVPGYENCLCGISTDITDLKKATNQLQERIKEQRCLYEISKLTEQKQTVADLLEKAVELIPQGWQYTDVTEAAIHFDGESYKTEQYRDTEWKLSAVSQKIEEKPLQIEVVYTQQKPDADKGPFLDEEQQLINSILEKLSSKIDRIFAQERLKQSEKRWESLVKNDPDLIQTLDDEGNIKFINQAGANMLGFDDPDEIIGKNYFDLIVLEEDKKQFTNQRIKNVLDGNEIESHIFKIRDSNGKLLYLESQAVPITLDNGERGLQQVASDVTDRVEYERELKESLKEKETLLQEVHHRVKNNLAVVSGMLQLQVFNTEDKTVQSLLGDSQKRIQTMALIHEKLYQSESLSNIDFGVYVEDLIRNVQTVSSANEEIGIDLEYDSFNLNVNQAVPCALILNEIISNAYEHAFTDQKEGTVNISLKESDETIHVRISDNGKGLPSTFDEKQEQSMGFTIIKTLIKQLNADFEVKNKNGTTISFSFKRQEIKGSSSSLV